MPKRKFNWWGTVSSVIKGRQAVDDAIKRIMSEYPESGVAEYIKLVYIRNSNTQEGAAALCGIDRRKANEINSKLHFYVAEKMGLIEKNVAKNQCDCG